MSKLRELGSDGNALKAKWLRVCSNFAVNSDEEALSIDNEQKRFISPVAVVSAPTLFACLDILTVSDQTPIGPTETVETRVNGPVPLSQVIEIASSRGLSIDAVRIDWQTLQSTIEQNDVLLVLENSNVVAAIENVRENRKEILVSDPLYQNGKPFLLQRDVLEDVWRGDALVVKRKPKSSGYPTGASVIASLLVALAATATISYFAVQSFRSEARNPTTAIGVSLADGADQLVREPRPRSTGSAESRSLTDSTGGQLETSSLYYPKFGVQTDGLEHPVEILRNEEEGSNAKSLRPPSGSVEEERIVAPILGKITTPSAIAQEEPVESANGIGSAPGPGLGGPGTESKPSEPAFQVASRSTDPEGSATAAKRDGSSVAGPSGAVSVVEKTKAAAAKYDPPPSPAGTLATVPGETSNEESHLLDYGYALISRADIASARLYYQQAADAGSAQGALRLGETYDPSFLSVIGVNERMADILLATKWYKRAVELGAQEAKILLEKL